MGLPWDRCVKTGSVEAPMGWICETIVMWSDLCHNWRRAGIGIPLADEAGALVASHATWVDNVILWASSTDQLILMVRQMSVLLYSRGYLWKPCSLQYMLCGFQGAPQVPILVDFTIVAPFGAQMPPHVSVMKRRRTSQTPTITIQLPRVQRMSILGVMIDSLMQTHVDVLHRISCGERAFWHEKRYYCCRDIPLIRRLRRYDGKVRAKILFVAEGMTSYQSTLTALHKCEGQLLAKMMWRSKGAGEDWTTFMQRVYLHARRALHSAGLPSLPQRFLYRQWCWAKDVCATAQRMSLSVQLPDPVLFQGSQLVPPPISVTADSQVSNYGSQVTPVTTNRRRMMRQMRERAQKRRRTDPPVASQQPPQSPYVPLDSSHGNTAYKRRRVRGDLGPETYHPRSLSRLCMLRAVSPWTEERGAFIRTLDSKEARVLTRRREGGRPAGFHP